jgi:hypothetical protein
MCNDHLGLIDLYAGPDDDPEADLDEWVGVTTTHDPFYPQYEIDEDSE